MVATYWAGQPAIRGEFTDSFVVRQNTVRPTTPSLQVLAFLRTSRSYLRDALPQKRFSDR